MATAGLYERSGSWLYDVGPAGQERRERRHRHGAPGKGAVAHVSPPLDAAGNSVRGQLATRFLSQRLGLNLFVSAPAPRASGEHPAGRRCPLGGAAAFATLAACSSTAP
jgi:glutaminase